LVKKTDSTLHVEKATSIDDFPQEHKEEIINIGISCDAKYIMTCSKDTIIKIWNLKGEILGTIDTRLGNNSFGCISNCGRFVAACGFTPDVKVWQVCFNKSSGEFKEIKRAFELKDHSAGVYHFSFNADSTRMASISKDKTWKLWNTNVEFDLGQDPSVLITGSLESFGLCQIALSSDAYSLAVSIDNNLYFYNPLTAKLDMSIEGIFQDVVNEIRYSNDNKYLAVCGDRNVKIFHNVTGFRSTIEDCNMKLAQAKTESAKDRLKQIIKDCK
jgi:transducin beta-like protein 2